MNTKIVPFRFLLLFPLLFFLGACSTMQSLHILEYKVKVIDQGGHPIQSALVESSDGDKTSTGKDGSATLKFAAVGVYSIKVTAEGRAPAAFSIDMPLDVGKSKTVRLVPAVTAAAASTPSGQGMAMANQAMAQALYPILFQSLFSNYGYSTDMGSYRPGQWTEWTLRGPDDQPPMKLRKAYLRRVKGGGQWWQMVMTDVGKKQPDLVMEVLLSKDMKRILRARQQMAGGQVSEAPVTEGMYTAPQHLTKESVEGAVDKRNVTVKVPAGKFKADRLRFSNLGAGTFEMWRCKKVPGGLVKTETLMNGESKWRMELTGYGQGAKTMLKSY